MAYEQMLVPVLEKQALAKNIYRMVLQCRSIAQQAACGQFVHLLPVGCTLRRPISICEINKAAGTLTIVFEVKGTGTDALANVRAGENVDILGPLGHGFTILPEAKHVVVVGGGIGNPPMLSLAQVYGERATAICGFRSANIVTLQDEFHASGAETILCTDDGTAGRQDLVTEPLKEQLAKEHDGYLRLAAEYDNFRKRSQREREQAYTDAVSRAVTALLPTYDNLERALKAETADTEYKKGVEMTMTQLVESLKGINVAIIDAAAGTAFDPNFHNAVMHVEDESLGENVIAETFQQGFQIGDKVIRHAMVKVAN